MTDIRCPTCNKKLAEERDGVIIVQCRRDSFQTPDTLRGYWLNRAYLEHCGQLFKYSIQFDEVVSTAIPKFEFS